MWEGPLVLFVTQKNTVKTKHGAWRKTRRWPGKNTEHDNILLLAPAPVRIIMRSLFVNLAQPSADAGTPVGRRHQDAVLGAVVRQ